MGMMKAYKIRNKETGQFSKGGTSTRWIWSKAGKTWGNIGHVKNHMHSFINSDGSLRDDYPYHNAEIVLVEVDYDECFRYDVSNLVDEMRIAKEEQARKDKERYENWIRERELKKLEELKKKYPENGS